MTLGGKGLTALIPFQEGDQPSMHRLTINCAKPVQRCRKLLRGPCPLLLPLCSHPIHHVGPYLISGDEAIAVSVQQFELFFLKGHPFGFADPAVLIGIHVLEHPIDHLLHSGVPVRLRSFSRWRRRLNLRKKKTPVTHKHDTNQDKNCFPSSHLTFLP